MSDDHAQLVAAVREALDPGEGGVALIKRIPLICNDILAIRKSNEAIINWIKGSAVVILFALVSVAVAWGTINNQVATNTKNIEHLTSQVVTPTEIEAAVSVALRKNNL